jgi:hypothetical protein
MLLSVLTDMSSVVVSKILLRIRFNLVFHKLTFSGNFIAFHLKLFFVILSQYLTCHISTTIIVATVYVVMCCFKAHSQCCEKRLLASHVSLSVLLSFVRLSAWNNSATTERIFVRFDI